MDNYYKGSEYMANNIKIPVIMFGKPSNNIEYNGIVRLNNWTEIYKYIHKISKFNNKVIR